MFKRVILVLLTVLLVACGETSDNEQLNVANKFCLLNRNIEVLNINGNDLFVQCKNGDTLKVTVQITKGEK